MTWLPQLNVVVSLYVSLLWMELLQVKTNYLAPQMITFLVILCTLDITSAGQDYQAVSNMYLGPFSNDDRRQCFTVNILNDTQSESPEYFMVNVHFCPGEQPERVDINPSSGNTTIIDDDGEVPI